MLRTFKAIAAWSLFFTTHITAGEFDLKQITTFEQFDATRGQTVVDGIYWAGKIAFVNGSSEYVLDAFDSQTGELIDSLVLSHSASMIYPYRDSKIILVGKSATPYWRAFVSIVKLQAKKIKIIKTLNIPEKYQIDKMAIVNGRFYFNERGDRAIITKSFWSYKPLGFSISGPDDMVGVNGELWMLEGRGIGHGDESLSVYDPRSKRYSQLMLESLGPRGISSLIGLEDLNLIAIDDAVGGRVIVIDSDTKTIHDQIDIGRDIRSLARYGQCIAALRTGAKQIVWLGLNGNREISELERWDLSPAGRWLSNPLDLSIDRNSGAVFVRSVLPCLFCDPSLNYNSTYLAMPKDESLRKVCQP